MSFAKLIEFRGLPVGHFRSSEVLRDFDSVLHLDAMEERVVGFVEGIFDLVILAIFDLVFVPGVGLIPHLVALSKVMDLVCGRGGDFHAMVDAKFFAIFFCCLSVERKAHFDGFGRGSDESDEERGLVHREVVFCVSLKIDYKSSIGGCF